MRISQGYAQMQVTEEERKIHEWGKVINKCKHSFEKYMPPAQAKLQ